MTEQAEIDALVEAFVQDLAELVRQAALSAVRNALTMGPQTAPYAGAPSSRRVSMGTRAAAKPEAVGPRSTRRVAAAAAPQKAAPQKKKAAPAPEVDEEPEEVEAKPESAPPPAPRRLRLDRQRRGRLIVVPSTPVPETPLADEEEAVASPRVREPKASIPAPEAAEVTPAKKWVIHRRPARDRANPATEPPPANGQAEAQPAGEPQETAPGEDAELAN